MLEFSKGPKVNVYSLSLTDVLNDIKAMEDHSTLERLGEPGFDIHSLSLDDRVELVKRSDGALSDLLKGIKIPGDLLLDHCESLESLPAGLEVGGNIYLEGCTSLKKFPEVKVGENIHLERCTSLKELPVGLKVVESLNLRGCTSLEELPENLEVGMDLVIGGCTSLHKLPKGLKVGNDIFSDGRQIPVPGDAIIGGRAHEDYAW